MHKNKGKTFVTPEEFIERKLDNDTEEVIVRTPGIIKAAEDTGENMLKFIISTGNPDREQDTIAVDGWNLKNYKKNPVILWAHDYSFPPVGKSMSIGVEDKNLVSEGKFVPEEIMPFGYMVYQMLKEGFLNATSVGLQALEWNYDEERRGINFLKQELMEYSIVPVPANPEALQVARSKGINTSPLKGWTEHVLDQWETVGKGLMVPKGTVEQAHKDADGKGEVSVFIDGGKIKEFFPEEEFTLELDLDSLEAKGEFVTITKEGDNNDEGTANKADGSEETATKSTGEDSEQNSSGDSDQGGQTVKEKVLVLVKGELGTLDAALAIKAMSELAGEAEIAFEDSEYKEVYDVLSEVYNELELSVPEYKHIETQTLKNFPDIFSMADNGDIVKLSDEARSQKTVEQLVEQLEQSSDGLVDSYKQQVEKAISVLKGEPTTQEGDNDVFIELSEEVTKTVEEDTVEFEGINSAEELMGMMEASVKSIIGKMTGKVD